MIIVNFRKEEKEKDISGLWQYDYGQILRIQGLDLPAAVEIHFSLQSKGGEAVTRVGTTRDEVTDVVIPDSMLENNYLSTDYSIYVFIYLTDETSGETAYKICMRVRSRPKPEAFDTPEDAELFRDAIAMVNEAANRAAVSEESAKDYETKAGRHYEETRTLAEQVSQEKETVMSTAQEVAKRAETVSLQTERTAKDAQEVATSVAQVRLLMEQNIQTAKQITEDRAEVEKLAEQVSDNADKASTSASEASTSAKNASASEKNVKTDAQEVAQKAQKVSSDMNKVTELAQKAKEYAEAAKNGVQGDWSQNDPIKPDHIKGRTHYEKKIYAEIYQETTISFSDNIVFENGIMGLVDGETYVVTWNGVEYTCVAIATILQGTKVIGIGNSVMYGGADTAEPFGIADLLESQSKIFATTTGASEATVKIQHRKTEIHKLDNKYIDAEWMAKTEVGEVDVLAETLLDSSRESAIIKQPLNLVEGNTYFVYFEGTRYECVAKAATVESIHVIGLGNAGFNGGEDTGEPFAIFELPVGIAEQLGYSTIAISSIAVPMFKIAVKESGMVTPKIPDKFLDLEWIPSEHIKTVLYPETTVTTTEGNELEVERGRNLLFNFEMGDTVIVNWDGTQYECVVYPYTNNNGTSLCIGNATLSSTFSYSDWQDNDKPFYICFTEHPNVFLYADAGKHTFSIEGYISTPKKIPEKYIPELSEFILKSTTEGSTKKFKVTVDDTGTIKATEITE